MVGTGVFTSLGFQLVDIQSPFVLLLLWVVGGVIALCGALCYAELGAAMPRSGGEYHYVGQLLHPALGFVSGWISATIGFAAPTALAAMTFGAYLAAVYPDLSPTVSAIALVIAVTLMHVFNRRTSAVFQVGFTALKVVVILCFCALAVALVPTPQPVSLLPASGDGDLLTGGAFAIALIYVNYAYTGWNAASYIAGEMNRPERDLPRVLALGTAIVLVLYLALNYVFLHTAPMEAMVGKVEVGYIAAQHAFGDRGATLMSGILAVLLISTVSAMIMAGPRVLRVIGEDFRSLAWLARGNASDVPVVAMLALTATTLILIVSGTFEAVLVFTSFTLSLNTLVTALCVFILRRRRGAAGLPFRMPLWPLPPLLFLALSAWTLVYILIERPQEGLLGIAIVTAGLLFYRLSSTAGKTITSTENPS
ncbi:MAG: amino acid permease [Pseudomonadales bacterium]|nr:amino acid permease [Pseudomonadales bacterium]MCP5183710.1 amino acid permease [Pseudomonadales bacterium]